MHQAGICNTVGLVGTTVSTHQIAVLKRLAPTVVLMLDGDDAGVEATRRAGALARLAGVEVLVASLPDGSGPAAVVGRNGGDAASTHAGDTRAFARFCVQYQIDRSDRSTAEGKDRLVAELQGVFAGIPSSAVREDLIALVAEHLELQSALVAAWIPTAENADDRSPAPPPRPRHSGRLTCLADPDAAAPCLQSRRWRIGAAPCPPSGRGHAAGPAAGLPAGDHELASSSVRPALQRSRLGGG